MRALFLSTLAAMVPIPVDEIRCVELIVLSTPPVSAVVPARCLLERWPNQSPWLSIEAPETTRRLLK